MPAENIIAIHDMVRNSGSSPSAPRGMLPYLLAASQMTKKTKPVEARAKSQPVLVTTQSSPLSEALDSDEVLMTPHRTKASDSTAVMPKMIQSMPSLSCLRRMRGSRAGWSTRRVSRGGAFLPEGGGCVGAVTCRPTRTPLEPPGPLLPSQSRWR